MAGYIQNNLVEINQATSVEAKSNNQENPAEFTNTFSNIISLEAGDKVSLQSSFIAERGSGNSKTIELKGKSLGIKRNFLYTALLAQGISYPEKQISYKVYTQTEREFELFDNKTKLVLSYYKNMNGTGYVSCPRKYISINTLSDLSTGVRSWSDVDSQANGYISPVPDFEFMMYADHYIEQFSKFVKLKNDNSKYTIFVAEANLFDNEVQEGPISPFTQLQTNPVDDWSVAPEYKQYYHYRELQEIEVPAGFNSADYVAGELSRQLQQVKSQTDLIFRANNSSSQDENLTSDIPITRIIESTTYKTFPCATELSLNASEYEDATNGSSSRWWNAWGCIALKRPELYVSGGLVNMNASVNAGVLSTTQDRLLGSRVAVAWDNTTASYDTPLVVNIPYNATNLLYLKNFLDSQTLYPEVYDSFNENIDQMYGGKEAGSYFTGDNDINGSNTRYFMMNQITNASQIEIDPAGQTTQWIYNRTSLGSSHYRGAHAGTNAKFRYSKLLLIYHNESDKDTFYENPKPDQYSYGCFRKQSVEIDGVDVDCVAMFPFHESNPTIQMPDWFLINDEIEIGRKFGYDLHWTAPTTCAITLFNGMRTFPNYYGRNANCQLNLPNYETTPAEAEAGTGVTVYNTPLNKTAGTNTQGALFNLRYVGADDPKISFDGEHFSITQLHTAENLGNRSANGGRYANYNTTNDFIYSKAEVNDDATSAVYKINPLEDINEFCPALMPYRGQAFIYTINGSAGAGKQTINDWNTNYQQYQVYDSKSGIFLEDMGYTENTWEDGLWGILGFSYEQFNGTVNNRQSRVDSNNIQSLKYPTTNAEIVTTDTKSWVVNDNGVPLYTDNIPAPFALAYYTAGSVTIPGEPVPPAYSGKNYQLFPEIVQKTTSTQLVADNFPRSMLRGYYTIRSDIIADSLFVGGQSNITNMPIVGIVTKENPQNDYYFGTGDVDFTIGKPTKLSSIRVSIHNPDGSYATVNKNSSIIFKIQRQMNVSFNIAEEILASEKGKKNKL